MKQTLSRYNRCVSSTESSAVEKKSEGNEQPQSQQQTHFLKQEQKEVDSLKDELAKLKTKQLRLLGKDLNGMGLNELRLLEHQLNEGLLAIKERKEELLIQQLEHSRKQEERSALECETLRRQAREAFFFGCSFLTQLLLPSHELQVEELRGLYPVNSCLPTAYLEYHHPLEKKYPILKESEESLDSDTACEDGVDNEDSNTTLQLGLPTIGRKRKKPEQESPSSNSENQVGSK
ncbi:hypothetical protein T459_02611 [Capsicum annuum]|uniref:K-box domain-containing protein n=1 Tax=Capsicum annuum TaxID=4072 RepID=A0A2G3AKH2_CAPAN|nr:putative serine carboxypeptidase-like 40-like [Capsicum annuum]PHT94729.1 hypothetical protein T459_02611 [Capsicum annuum]